MRKSQCDLPHNAFKRTSRKFQKAAFVCMHYYVELIKTKSDLRWAGTGTLSIVYKGWPIRDD